MNKDKTSKWWNFLTLVNPGLYLFTRDKMSEEFRKNADIAMAGVGILGILTFVVFIVYLVIKNTV